MTEIEWLNTGILIFNYFVLFFVMTIMSSYLLLAAISGVSLKSYLNMNRFVDHNALLSLSSSPKISLIAPAFNESMVIKESIISLLSINYNNFDLIVINDGSTDDSIPILIEAFDLELVDLPYNPILVTKPLKAIYKSKNPSFSKLIVVDKENGGKSDALNLGINIIDNPYIVCIDVDCIMDKDVLLKLVKPFMEQSEKNVIATGGVVRIANSCVVKSGKLIEVHAPDNFLAKIQVLEYLRAFNLGRMAWAKLDGLLLISGAFGMFDRNIVIKCGGYNTKTVGEDMELVVRMRRYMVDNHLKYAVQYIPDPLCWTEAPETFTILRKQRSRWTRGTMETLWIHRRMFFNPKYKILGFLSYPYWLIFEYLAPLIEITGILITFLFIYLQILNISFFILLTLLVYSFAVMFSMLALYSEEVTYGKYATLQDLRKLALVSLLEPIVFHPFTVYAALKGNIEKITGNHSWGEMTRTGFKIETEIKDADCIGR